jgi:hypothetical protein
VALRGKYVPPNIEALLALDRLRRHWQRVNESAFLEIKSPL